MVDRPPGPFEGVDESALSREEFLARIEKWRAANRAWVLEKRGPLKPGGVSRAKIEDVMGDAVARGMHDYRVDRARWAAEHQAADAGSDVGEGGVAVSDEE